jgi:hypothetical protein
MRRFMILGFVLAVVTIYWTMICGNGEPWDGPCLNDLLGNVFAMGILHGLVILWNVRAVKAVRRGNIDFRTGAVALFASLILLWISDCSVYLDDITKGVPVLGPPEGSVRIDYDGDCSWTTVER